jgi:hypothetical protein
MSSYSLRRIALFPNQATTQVVLAASHRIEPKPDLPLSGGSDHGHDHGPIPLPVQNKVSTPNSLKRLLLAGNLKVTNSFTSKYHCHFQILSLK